MEKKYICNREKVLNGVMASAKRQQLGQNWTGEVFKSRIGEKNSGKDIRKENGRNKNRKFRKYRTHGIPK